MVVQDIRGTKRTMERIGMGILTPVNNLMAEH